MLNMCTIGGRLAKDPATRTTQSGTLQTNLTIAVERDYKDKQSGQRITDFFNVVCFGSSANFAAKYLKKGQFVGVTGRIQFSSYEKDGVKRQKTELLADSVYSFASSNSGSGNHAAPAAAQNQSNGFAPAAEEFTSVEDDGNLPF